MSQSKKKPSRLEKRLKAHPRPVPPSKPAKKPSRSKATPSQSKATRGRSKPSPRPGPKTRLDNREFRSCIVRMIRAGLSVRQIERMRIIDSSTIQRYQASHPQFAASVKGARAGKIAEMMDALCLDCSSIDPRTRTTNRIFWLKAVAGLNDRLEVTGKDGGPIETRSWIDRLRSKSGSTDGKTENSPD